MSEKYRNSVFTVLILIFIMTFLMLVLNQKTVIAQPPGWSDDIRLTNAALYSGDPSISIDGENIYVVWEDERNGGAYDDYEIYFKKSTDNGKTWSKDVRLSNAPHYSLFPKIAVNGSNIHVIWSDDREGGVKIFYNRSEDGGETWIGERRISPVTTKGSPESLDIVLNGSKAHVVYSDHSEASDSNLQLYYINSSDNGQTWSSTQRLTSLFRNSVEPSIAVNCSDIHIVWMDYYDRFGSSTMGAIFYINSSDGGLTWSEDFNLTPMNLDSDYPDIVANGDIIHVTFSEWATGVWETHYRRSENSGISWSEDVQLTDWDRDHWGSSIDVYDANVSVVWWTSWIEEPDGNGEIYYINSTDNGHSWGENLRLTFDPERAGQADISVSESFINIVWDDNRDDNVEIYYKQYPVFADLSTSPDDITFSDNVPNLGVLTQINTIIQNIGNENVSATIEFWDGNPDNSCVFIDSTDVTVNISESVNAMINWIPITNGIHNIYVRITNSLETNLSNNIANKSVFVNREPELSNIPSTYILSEDSIENQLINLSEYANDDLDSWDELTFSVVSYSNSSIVNISIFSGHFLRVDALTDSANDNWTGTIEIMIEVIDTHGLTNVSNQFTVTVTDVNDAPIIVNPIPNFNIYEDTSDSTTVNLTYVFFDSDNSSLFYTYSGNTNVNVIIHRNGSVTFIPLENWAGDETITFYTTDNLTDLISENVTITVMEVNDPPIVTILSPLNNSNHFTSDTIYFNITVFDIDSNTFTYLWNFGDGTTSTLKNATHQFSKAGIYNVSITVSDGLASYTMVVTILVESAPPSGSDNGFNIWMYLLILIVIAIVVILLSFFIWWRFKSEKKH
ncbi:MAG: PKD domain-containing protein [Thermoplasmata archaeon]|nr:MAG: PKD domain-containing protein [Thermoplasmata archaeon]